MTLNDALFANMTQEQWNRTIEAKVHGSKNLHDVTITQPLDFFVLLSSLHSFIGNPGQTNYAAGCAYQVALAQYRTHLGLPATAIDLGIVGDVGYVVEKKKVSGSKVQVQGFTHISEAEMLALIELGVRNPLMGHLVTGLDSDIDVSAVGQGELPFFARDPVLSHLEYLRPHLRTTSPSPSSSAADTVTTSSSLSLSAQLFAHSSSEDDRKSILLAALLKKLSRSLMMQPEEFDTSRALTAYGTDSLVAVELKNWVAREVKVAVSVFDVLQGASIERLVEKILERFDGGMAE